MPRCFLTVWMTVGSLGNTDSLTVMMSNNDWRYECKTMRRLFVLNVVVKMDLALRRWSKDWLRELCCFPPYQGGHASLHMISIRCESLSAENEAWLACQECKFLPDLRIFRVESTQTHCLTKKEHPWTTLGDVEWKIGFWRKWVKQNIHLKPFRTLYAVSVMNQPHTSHGFD